jgi:hypothetical protein
MMGQTVHAEFVVHSKGVTNQGQELPDGLSDEEMAHIESTGALDEGGPPATDAVDAAYGTKSGSEENYLGETPPDPPEEEEPAQPPFVASDEQEEFYGEQPARGEWGTVFTPEGGTRKPEPSPVVNQAGEEVTPPPLNMQGGTDVEKTKLEAPKEAKAAPAKKEAS